MTSPTIMTSDLETRASRSMLKWLWTGYLSHLKGWLAGAVIIDGDKTVGQFMNVAVLDQDRTWIKAPIKRTPGRRYFRACFAAQTEARL